MPWIHGILVYLNETVTRSFLRLTKIFCKTVPTAPADAAGAGAGGGGGGKKSKIVYGKRKPAHKSKQAAAPVADTPAPPPTPSASEIKAKEEAEAAAAAAKKKAEEEEEEAKAKASAAEEEAAGGDGAADDWEDAVDDWDSADVTVRLETRDERGTVGVQLAVVRSVTWTRRPTTAFGDVHSRRTGPIPPKHNGHHQSLGPLQSCFFSCL